MSVKNFLNKPAGQLTIADTFLMQMGNAFIALAVPTIVGTLTVIFTNRKNSQESQGL